MLKRVIRSFSKICSVKEAISFIKPGMTVLSGGFGLCGIPATLLQTLSENQDINNLTVVSNNAGTDSEGLGLLLQTKQIKRMISSYVGENKLFEKMYLSGELELEITPQGTLAEKIRAGGAGIPIFTTATGVGTILEDGGFFIKNSPNDESKAILSEPKPTYTDQNDKKYLVEKSIKGDVALIKAYKADRSGNLVFNKTARNFNQDMAKAADLVIAEVEEIVETGELHPHEIQTPSIYVDKIVLTKSKEKSIERLTNTSNMAFSEDLLKDPKYALRVKIAKRAALEITANSYLNLGIGMPTLVPIFIPEDYNVCMQSENGLLGLGGYPEPGKEDPDLVDPAKQTVIMANGASLFSSSESFAMIRGGHLDWTLLGAMEVSQNGDIANWIIPGKMVKGMGGAMDLVGSNSKVMVLTEHTSKNGKSKILKECKLPLTGKKCVSKIITELAVFEVTDNGLVLTDIAEETTLDTVKNSTEADFTVSPDLKKF